MMTAGTQRITVISESEAHWLPQITQFMLKNKIGTVSYPIETEDERF